MPTGCANKIKLIFGLLRDFHGFPISFYQRKGDTSFKLMGLFIVSGIIIHPKPSHSSTNYANAVGIKVVVDFLGTPYFHNFYLDISAYLLAAR
jgi:hypothetical protein